MAKVEIYTQPGCPFCQKALTLLNSKGVKFNQINAPKGTAERKEAIKRSGGKITVPQIFINGQSVGGCDDLLRMEETGKLDALLK